MTVGELIAKLQEHDTKAKVVIDWSDDASDNVLVIQDMPNNPNLDTEIQITEE